MTTWFVTRHVGAALWGATQRVKEKYGDVKVLLGDGKFSDASFDVSKIRKGDVVIGTLPVQLASTVCTRGARYVHLSLDIPRDFRGRELTATEMDGLGAKLEEFVVAPKGETLETIPPAPPPTGSIHVCLVSDQQMANLLPALKRRPERLVLVATGRMDVNGSARRLCDSLAHFGFATDSIIVKPCPDTCSTDSVVARDFARNLRLELREQYPDKVLTLNATGGTKPLSRAFTLEFGDCEQIYTDTSAGVIRFLSDVPTPPEELGNQITTVEDYLWCQNYSVVSCDSDNKDWLATARKREDLTFRTVAALVSSANEICNLINSINRATREFSADATRQHREIDDESLARNGPFAWRGRKTKAQRSLMKNWRDGGLIEFDDKSVTFSSASAFHYIAGKWLEEYAYLAANSLGVDDVDFKTGMYVVASRDEQLIGNARNNPRHTDNELDLIILYRNQVLIAECKAVNWASAEQQKIMNRLDALGTHAKGLFGSSMLVSARPLDEGARRRARLYGVSVIAGEELGQLRYKLAETLGIKVAPLPRWDAQLRSHAGTHGSSAFAEAFQRAKEPKKSPPGR